MSMIDLAVILVCGVIGFAVVSNIMTPNTSQKAAGHRHTNEECQQNSQYSSFEENGSEQGNWRKPTPENWHEVLGVLPGASASEIKTAYRSLTQQYHPDRFATAAPEIREYAANKMQNINAAFQSAERVGRVNQKAD